MNIDQLNTSGHIIYSILSGSHLYGLNVPESDIDTRGIFNLPLDKYILPDSPKQISCETNDTTYYEIARFLHLLKSANPNMLELLFAPEDKMLIKSPIMDNLLKQKHIFLTKACRNSVGGYAVIQIGKARSQNKRCYNEDIKRLGVLDFCYVYTRGRSGKLTDLLRIFQATQEDTAVSAISHIPHTYRLYSKKYALNRCPLEASRAIIADWIPKGLISPNGESNELRLTSIPKEVAMYGEVAILYFNKDEYQIHCKEYKDTQDWIANRNKKRYSVIQETGENYDVKNMMHCMRLLNMGIELATTGELNVVRTHDREFLLDIRRGKYTYSYLKGLVEEKIVELDESFASSNLPNSVNNSLVDQILLEFKGF